MRALRLLPLLLVACGSPSATTSAKPPPLHLTPRRPATLALADEFGCVVDGARVVCWGADRAPYVEETLAGSTTISGSSWNLCGLDAAGTSLRCLGSYTPFGGPTVQTVEGAAAIEVGSGTVVRTRDAQFFDGDPSRAIDVPTSTVNVWRVGGTTCALGEGGTLTCTIPEQPALVIDEVLDVAWRRGSAASSSPESFAGVALCVLHRDAVECGSVAAWRAATGTARIEGTHAATRLVAGEDHVCVLATDGSVFCAGANERGELGQGHRNRADGLVRVAGVSRATELEASGHHTCARAPDATRCWGDDKRQQSSGVPVVFGVVAIEGARSLFAGWGNTCALDASGALLCWGVGHAGQLGDGDAICRMFPTPASLPGVTGITEVVLGVESTCVLFNGHVACFGGDSARREDAPALWALADATHIGGGEHLVAVARSSSGPRARMELYDAASGNSAEREWRSAGGGYVPSEVAQVTGNGEFACARSTDGHAWCWGSDFSGECGGGDGFRTPVTAAIPMPPSGVARERLRDRCQRGGERSCGRPMSGIRVLSSRGRTTCAVLESGRIACWGEDRHGRFADEIPPFLRFARRPVLLDGIENAQGVCVGGSHLCVLADAGTVTCRGHGPAGAERSAELAALDQVVEIVCGGEHACARRVDGSVRCWGSSATLGSEALIRASASVVAMP